MEKKQQKESMPGKEKILNSELRKPNSVNVNTEIKIGTTNHESIEAVKITTIVELIRNKTKYEINKIKTRSKRETSRSLSIVANPRNLTGEALSTTLLRNFYGLPRITTEDPQISGQSNIPVSNFGHKENINVFETKSLPVPHPFSFLHLPLSAYNDSIATEVDDLNISPPLQRYVKRIKTTPEIDIRFSSTTTTTPKPSKIKKQRQIVKKPDVPLLNEATNTTYINIQDHRKNLLKDSERQTVPGYPEDIPPYNPDIIPYVHVPDYSDQREESLDKNDRPLSKDKFKDYGDQDFVDPTAPVDSTKEAEPVKGTDKPKVSAQTPHVDIQDYRPSKDTHKCDKKKEIPVHETQSEDTSRKQSQETQTLEESSAEDKQPFSFKELFKELNLPYDEDDETKEEDDTDAEGSYSDKRRDASQEPSTSETHSLYEETDDNEREKSTEAGDDDHTNEDAKLIRITDDEFKYGDKDFFKPFFENSGDISSHEYYYSDDDDDDEDEKKKNRKREVPDRKRHFGKKYTSRSKDKRNKLRSHSDTLAKTKKRKERKGSGKSNKN